MLGSQMPTCMHMKQTYTLLVPCSERAETTSSHAKAKKELLDMAEAMKVRRSTPEPASA